MTLHRRDFLQLSAAAGVGAFPLGRSLAPKAGTSAAHPLRILILGGTSFLGPHQIRYALERGHSITTFTRGRTAPTVHRGVFDHVESLIGDREGDHSALDGREWDAVIDNSGNRVEWTRTSANLLRDQAGLYMYTSSTGVYYPYLGTDITEQTHVLDEDPPSERPRTRPSFGVMKVQSEAAAREAFGEDRTVVVRPTYIVGPADRSNRFPYWPARIEQGGEVLVPGEPDDPVQYIDVRDLTEFQIRLIEQSTSGTFNVAGPGVPQGMEEFVHGVRAAVSADVEWVPIPDRDFLREHGLRFAVPWIPPTGDNLGSARVNVTRARGAGLTYRPLARTVFDTLDWWHSDAVTAERREQAWSGERGAFPLNRQGETAIIEAWRAR